MLRKKPRHKYDKGEFGKLGGLQVKQTYAQLAFCPVDFNAKFQHKDKQ